MACFSASGMACSSFVDLSTFRPRASAPLEARPSTWGFHSSHRHSSRSRILPRRLQRCATQAEGEALGLDPKTAASLPALAKDQLGCAELGDGQRLWLEVLRTKRDGSVEALCEGEVVRLQEQDGALTLAHQGFWPRLSDSWVKRAPGLVDSLQKLRSMQRRAEELPSQRAQQHGITGLRAGSTVQAFEAAVAAAPGPWCDGTGPEDPPLTADEQAFLTAGELSAFLSGLRGVAILQLLCGWDNRLDRQPLLRPLVLRLLQRAAEDKRAALLPAAAPGGLGASLLLAARCQPYKAWAEHLAGLGVQAGIVADSPFYKLLIGRVLGYSEANVHFHIRSTGGTVDGAVVQAVDEELAALSTAAPKLPWTEAARSR